MFPFTTLVKMKDFCAFGGSLGRPLLLLLLALFLASLGCGINSRLISYYSIGHHLYSLSATAVTIEATTTK